MINKINNITEDVTGASVNVFSIPFLLRLQQVPGFGSATIQSLLLHYSEKQLIGLSAEELQQAGWNEQQIQSWFHPQQKYIDNSLNWLEERKSRSILSVYHNDYPFLLKQTVGAPLLLFVEGDVQSLSLPQLALVGSRFHSEYGEYWARYFSQQLVANGFAITSGLALGIDSIAHGATLDVGGKTLAVLGSGLGNIYPTRHRKLAQRIVEQGGVLVSEFTPETLPIAQNFPRRNRIISGLSVATLVIEAAAKSGSLITARYALEQNREVFALPSSIHSEFSRGCHYLIKQGAMLVEDISDILENLSFTNQFCHINSIEHQYSNRLEHKRAVNTPSNMLNNLNLNQQKDFHQENCVKNQVTPKSAKKVVCSYPELYAHIGYEALAIDNILEVSNLKMEELTQQLLILELEGAIRLVEGGYCRI